MTDKAQAGGKVIDLMAALKASLNPDKVCPGCQHVHTETCDVAVSVKGDSAYELCGCSDFLAGAGPEGQR